ncbi:MAG: BMP family ABC transporter substrate-binding protein [Cellulosilyticaceae bacterium]
MKKLIVCILSVVMMLSTLVGCGGAEQVGGAETTGDSSKLKVALISDTIGTEQFILQAYNKVKEMAEIHGFEWTSMECLDTAQWEENTRAASNEGYNLVIGIGWQAADPFSQAAEENPDIKYAVIDTVAPSDKVTSIGFNETEGAYVLGTMIGTAFPNENVYGYIASFQNQGTFKYRYGFSEGVKSVNPEAKFIYNYVNSYSDTNLAYEYAMQQKAAGANFIMGGISASANTGIYQAAMELAKKGTPIYTTGLSIDQTTQDNPYIVGGLLKNTAVCVENIINDFLNDSLVGGMQILGIKENAFGVVNVTTETANFVNTEIMTEEAIAAGKAAADKIISGELVIVAPEESNN